MRKSWLLRALKILVLVAAAILVAGVVVMALWNWLIPPLTGWHRLAFPQAIALLVLCKILFGRGGPWRHGRFRQMSPEERERFREDMRARCGRSQTPASEQS